MQFHENGFHFGDPRSAAPAGGFGGKPIQSGDALDVLVVGSGPAGSIVAAQMARFPGIRTRIVERRAGPLQLGRADGVSCRTVEMLQAFGLARQLVDEAYWVNEAVFWRPDGGDPTRIARSGRVRDVEEGLSEFPHVIVNQARVQDYLIESMRASPTRMEVDYGLELTELVTDDDPEHPVTATFQRADGEVINVRARYVVGCDGARSVVRRSIRRELVGDGANHAWGVLDVLAVTDFPDIRLKAAIQSSGQGNILLIPREGGYLVRLYVDLGTVSPSDKDLRGLSREEVIGVARRVLHPFSFDVREVAWFSIYEVGQRLADGFDDVPADRVGVQHPRVFIAGDACHTHSAKAGQGMNVSMQDAFNLAWKLAAVLEGRSPRVLLETYSVERHAVAQELIEFDREWSAIMASPPSDERHPEQAGIDPAVLQAYFQRSGRYTAGLATKYTPSLLTGESTYQHLARGYPIGMRFHSAPVVRLADAKPMQLGHVHSADGRWRLYLFADAEGTGLRDLCDWLQNDTASPVRRYTPAEAEADSVIDVRAIYPQRHDERRIEDLPPFLLPRKGRFSLLDYEKTFAIATDDVDIFDARQIDRQRGVIVVVRPDQYVATVLPLDARVELAGYLEPLLIEPEVHYAGLRV